MRRGTGRIAAPDENELTLEQHFGSRSQPPADRQHNGFFSSSPTDGTLQATRPQPVPETSMRYRAMHQPQRTRVTIRQNALRSMSLDTITPSTRNFRDGFIPGDTLEFATAFRPGAAQGIAQPVRVVHTIQVAI